MYSINFKGKPNPKNPELVKIEMILFKSDYPRIPKVINLTGYYKDWDSKTQNFKSKTPDAINKNKQLLDLKVKYLKVIEDWEADDVDWSPVQWSHCFDSGHAKKKQAKVLSVLQTIEHLEGKYREKERVKNGKVIISTATMDFYKALRVSLTDFTKGKYNRSFSSYYFEDIDTQFFEDYVLFLQKRGIKNGNKGGIVNQLKTLKATLNYANKMKIPGVNLSAYLSIQNKAQRGITTPKTIPYEYIKKIEDIDRTLFSKNQQLHIDAFLFSFYSGGMANIDITYLTWGCIQGDRIIYERMKTQKEAKMPLLNKAAEIINRYKGQCYADYVLPILKENHKTDIQKRIRVSSFSQRVNNTLKIITKMIKYDGKITWYSARGTYITKMIDEGYNPELVAEHAGNSPQIIYKHYYKVTNHEDLVKHLNKIF
jgi:integrase